MAWAAHERGVPMTVLDVPRKDAPAEYRHALVLCRADQHVAWRGDTVPEDAGALADLLCGRAPAEAPTERNVP